MEYGFKQFSFRYFMLKLMIMIKEKVLVWKNDRVLAMAQLLALLGIAIVAPFFHQQFITGAIVNATLFIAVMTLGLEKAIIVGLVPSIVALSTGTLPGVLAPMIPYIMIGNTILVFGFNWLKNKSYWLAIVSSSLLKFLFLFSMSSVMVSLVVKKEIAGSIATMMSWPQLVTALSGGLLAFVFLKILKKS
jgi:hypothetical protein